MRLARQPLFIPLGRDLYQRIALLGDILEGQELLVAPAGRGTTLEYFVREHGVNGSGVDEDLALVEEAEARAREAGLLERTHLQAGSMGELPYRDGVFDVVIGEIDLTAHVEPERAIAELTRVLRPGGRLAVVQLVWKAPVDPARRDVLASHLGVRPLLLVELKRMLFAAGVERLHTEGWSESSGLRPAVSPRFPDLAQLFSFPVRLGIVRQALGKWGWRAGVAALFRQREAHYLLTRDRILGLTLVSGRKAGATDSRESEQTEDLPLFAQSERR